MEINLTSCISVDYDLALLPHFLEHYTKLDIDKYLLIFHSNQDFDLNLISPYLENIKHKVETYKWVGSFNMKDKVDYLNRIVQGDYILTADVDEFQIWNTTLRDIIKEKNITWGRLRDRESEQDLLLEVTQKSIFDQFPLITSKFDWGPLSFKPCLFPSKYKLLSPHHLQENKPVYDNYIDIDHFRFIKGRLEKSEERLQIYDELNQKGIKPQYFYRVFPTVDSQKIIDYFKFNKHKSKSII